MLTAQGLSRRVAVRLVVAAVAATVVGATGAMGASGDGVGEPFMVRGIYAHGFEVASFQPCDSAERWWVAHAGPLAEEYARIARPYEQVYAVVVGDTSALTHAGHLGLYQRYFRIIDVVSIEPMAQQHWTVRARCPDPS
jgi:hypothetical protein